MSGFEPDSPLIQLVVRYKKIIKTGLTFDGISPEAYFHNLQI